jgi:WD40 repeat protein
MSGARKGKAGRARRCRAALAFWFAIISALSIPAPGRADREVQLVASGPTVLNHPPINKSAGNPVHCLVFVDGGATLATGAASGVFVWDVASGKVRQTLPADERGVDTLALDPRGAFLIAGGASGVIKVWDTRTWKEIRSLGPTARAVRGLAISPDGKVLASASPDGQKGEKDREFGIILWDLTTGQKLRTIPQPPPAFGTTALSFLPDGRKLLAAQDRTFRVWDVEKSEEAKAVELRGVVRSLGSVALRGDGRRLATGVFESRIRVWDTESWEQVLAWDAHDQEPAPRRGVVCVGYSPDGKFVLSGGMDGVVCVWEASSGRRLLQLDAGGESSRGRVTGVAMTADGGTLAASQFDGTATIWRIARK